MLSLSRSSSDGGDSVVVDVDEKDKDSKNVDETDADEDDDELSEQRSNKPMAMVAIEWSDELNKLSNCFAFVRKSNLWIMKHGGLCDRVTYRVFSQWKTKVKKKKNVGTPVIWSDCAPDIRRFLQVDCWLVWSFEKTQIVRWELCQQSTLRQKIGSHIALIVTPH